MASLSFSSLLAVAAIALAAPLLVSLAPRLRMPAVVLEIVFGIVVGPSGLGWVRVDVPVSVLALIGLSFLLFLAGLELNLGALRGRLTPIVGAYGLSAVLALGGGGVIALLDSENKPLFIAIVLASTSLGLVVPVLRDAGQTFSAYGQLVLAASSVGEFGAIVALAIFYSGNGSGFGAQLFLLIGFAILVAAVAAGLVRIERSPRFAYALAEQGESSAQLGVRVAILVLAVFAALSSGLGFEAVLGAFVAGALLRLTDPEERLTNERLRSKLDAIGYGFLIPAFFVTSGLQFNVSSLVNEPTAIAAVPLLLVLLFIARCLPNIALPSSLRDASGDRSRVAPSDVVVRPGRRGSDRHPAAHDRRRHGRGDHRRWSSQRGGVPTDRTDAPVTFRRRAGSRSMTGLVLEGSRYRVAVMTTRGPRG